MKHHKLMDQIADMFENATDITAETEALRVCVDADVEHAIADVLAALERKEREAKAVRKLIRSMDLYGLEE